MNDELTDLLDRHNWGDSIIKLTAYVVSLCRLQPLPSGLEPEDVVMEAIEKVYTGERNWNPQQESDLHRYMLSVVTSIVSNIRTRKESVYTATMNEEELAVVPGYDNVEAELFAKELDDAIAVGLKGDAELCLLYKAIKDGYSMQDISQEYVIDINILYNAKKRLNRLVNKVIGKFIKRMKDAY